MTLYERVPAGVDAFKVPVYTEAPVTVENVLVYPTASKDVVSEAQLGGRYAGYELLIPRDDTHTWEGCSVEFFGRRWKVLGYAEEWIPANLPLGWNKRVQVERYG